jgi:hypothetical protein
MTGLIMLNQRKSFISTVLQGAVIMRHLSGAAAVVVFLISSLSLASEESKKIIYVDSYHREYQPNILTRKGFKSGLKGYRFDIHYEFMDAKRKKTEALQMSEALRIKKIIDKQKPDLIVASDDSASKYLIAPYFKNSNIPVVFCGVNWDASAYGFPAANITGQVEVELISELISSLQRFSKGKHLGIISGNTLTDRKSIKQYSEVLGVRFNHVVLVNTMEEWKKGFVDIQKHVDVLVLRHNAGIKGWIDSVAREFIVKNTSIPTGSITSKFGQYSLICFPKMNYEFGEIAADMAEKILFKGIDPAEIHWV